MTNPDTNPDTTPHATLASPLWRILALWRRQAPALILGALIALAALASFIALMAQSARFIGAAIAGIALVVPLSLSILGVARVVLRYLERLSTHDAMFRALAALRVWFLRGLAGSAAGGLGLRRAGDLLSRLITDIDALDGIYLRILIPGVSALMLVPILLWAIGRDNVIAAIIVLGLFGLIAFLLPQRAMRAARAAAVAQTEAASALRVAALDALTGLREIKVFGAEGRMLANIQAKEAGLFSAERGLAARGAVLQAVSFLAAQAALLAVLLIGGAHAPIAVLIAAFVVIAAFEVVGGMPRAGALAGIAAEAARRVIAAAEAPPSVPDPADPLPLSAATALRFDDVQFRWSPDHPMVLDQLSLQVPAGARVAVLGPSGAGKSTLAALALKLAAPQAGSIRLGGVDLARLSAADVRTRIAYLAQTTHLFADTVRNNLRLARPDATDAQLWTALEAARIADMVRGLPDQLDAWVGEQGAQFSGGEGRRLALARTLLSPAPILILDEPCAGLDPATERDFMTTLNLTTEGRSVLLITHRLTGVEKLDRVWRLQAGRLTSATF
ncbi:MAG: thiol reductant ABC exporter subunit CydC [Acidiphilium sp.]